MSDESTTPIEPKPATPREQLDALIAHEQQAFLNTRLQLAAQEGFIGGLSRARNLIFGVPEPAPSE